MSALDRAENAALAPAQLDARFRRPLMSYFLSRVGDRADAEDLTQQTFLRLLGGERDAIRNPAAFVFRVAASLVRDRGRTRTRRAQDRTVSFDADGVEGLALSDPLTPERVVIARDDVAKVLEALGELGERTQEIFVLFRFENLRQWEIAERFGMTSNAVEKHVMRATLHLARRVGAG
jgi:RNA polymerase sigma factor (sigma-70 family)